MLKWTLDSVFFGLKLKNKVSSPPGHGSVWVSIYDSMIAVLPGLGALIFYVHNKDASSCAFFGVVRDLGSNNALQPYEP